MDDRRELGDALAFTFGFREKRAGLTGQGAGRAHQQIDQTLSPWQVGRVLFNGSAQ